MKIRILTAAELREVLPMRVAIDAMRQAYGELSAGRAIVPQRLSLPVEPVAGVTLVKPALTSDGLGAKLVSVFPRNNERGLPVTPGIVIALDRDTGIPIGICDGTYLTALRTGAAVGAATGQLARTDSRVAALIGCGGQAPTLLEALDSVLDLETIRLFDRNRERAERLAETVEREITATLQFAGSAAAAVEDAAVVSTATTSTEPVFEGRRLAAGTHINAIGSFTPMMREIDVETVRRSRVYVDSIAAVAAEAGDLLAASAAGATRVEEWTEIGAVFNGVASGRRDADEITLFKSVGVAVQDVTAAAWAIRRATAANVGRLIEL